MEGEERMILRIFSAKIGSFNTSFFMIKPPSAPEKGAKNPP